MNTATRVGALFVMIAASSAPVLGPDAFARPKPQNDDEVDVSSPCTLIGEVLVKTDAQGRVAVVVDETRGGRAPDGGADRLFLLTAAAPVTPAIHERFPVASVIFRGASVSVSSPTSALTIDLAIGTGQDSQRTIEPHRIVIHDGIALQSIGLVEAARLDAVDLDRRISVREISDSAPQAKVKCNSGGAGSVTCSHECAFFSMGLSRTDKCSVTCAAGYYACCGCNALYKASCLCVREKPANPGAPRTSADF